MRLTIAVVIAARDPGPYLVETLESISRQDRSPDEVVVVDDGSTDGSVARAALDHPSVRVEHRAARGVCAARNEGVSLTSADALVLVDADDRLAPGALARLAAELEGDPQLSCVHGAIREFVDPSHPPPATARPAHDVVAGRIGGATLLRRSLWDRVGGFDLSLVHGEWVDWLHRAEGVAPSRQIDTVVLERRLHARNRSNDAAIGDQYLAVARAAIARRRSGPPSG